LPLGRRRRDRSRYSYGAETQYGSSSKSNPFPAFLQSIAFVRNCRFVDSIRPAFRTVCLRFVADASRDCFCGFDDSNSSDRNGRKSLSILRGTGGDFQHSRQTRPSAGDHNEGSDSQLPFLLANNIEFDLDLRAITTFLQLNPQPTSYDDLAEPLRNRSSCAPKTLST
jgi:hypothetical protein